MIKYIAYKLIDVQEYFKCKYYQFFTDTILSVKAYSSNKNVTLYNYMYSFIYPIRFYKSNDIIYEDNALIEVIHTRNKETITTVIPAVMIYDMSSKDFIDHVNRNVKIDKVRLVDFTVLKYSMISLFNKISHSFTNTIITVNMIVPYMLSKSRKKFECPPYTIEILDDCLNDETFKENNMIKLNKNT